MYVPVVDSGYFTTLKMRGNLHIVSGFEDICLPVKDNGLVVSSLEWVDECLTSIS
jgi:hypothetical protein